MPDILTDGAIYITSIGRTYRLPIGSLDFVMLKQRPSKLVIDNNLRHMRASAGRRQDTAIIRNLVSNDDTSALDIVLGDNSAPFDLTYRTGDKSFWHGECIVQNSTDDGLNEWLMFKDVELHNTSAIYNAELAEHTGFNVGYQNIGKLRGGNLIVILDNITRINQAAPHSIDWEVYNGNPAGGNPSIGGDGRLLDSNTRQNDANLVLTQSLHPGFINDNNDKYVFILGHNIDRTKTKCYVGLSNDRR